MSDKKIVDIKEFKSKAKEGNTENIAVRKQFSIEVKEVDEENRIIEFVASTPGRDRDMDTINAEGWDLTNYEKNPVILWAHDYSSPPIGKAVENYIQNGELRQKVKFIEKDIYPFADMVYRMYKSGYLNAVSVGFDPKEWEWSDDEEGNIDFYKQELLETSAVPVPANPEALQVAGIEEDKELINSFAKEVKEWSDEILDTKKNLEGSIEQMAKEAIEEYFNLEGEYWIFIDGVFDDYVVATVENEDGMTSYQFDYTMEDGEFILEGEPEEVEIDLVVSPQEESYELEVDIELEGDVAEFECPHCEGKLYTKVAKSTEDYINLAQDDDKTDDKIQINPDELSQIIREKVQEQITKQTGKIF
jgi:HK97 family phage prohead protease